MSCSLCEGLRHVVERGPFWTLALNLNQNLPGRCVLALNRHAEDVTGLTPAEWASLRAELRRVRNALASLFDPDLYNYAFLMNQDAHVHLHIVPRYSSPREWQGETFTDPHFGALFGTEQKLLPEEALDSLAATIRANLPPVEG